MIESVYPAKGAQEDTNWTTGAWRWSIGYVCNRFMSSVRPTWCWQRDLSNTVVTVEEGSTPDCKHSQAKNTLDCPKRTHQAPLPAFSEHVPFWRHDINLRALCSPFRAQTRGMPGYNRLNSWHISVHFISFDYCHSVRSFESIYKQFDPLLTPLGW